MEKRRKLVIAIIALVAVLASVVILGVVLSVRNANTLRLALNGGKTVTLEYGTAFQDPGAAAWIRGKDLPEEGLDLTDRITVEGTVDTAKVGKYVLTYTVRYTVEGKELTTTETRTVRVVDTQAPVITLTTNPGSFTYPGHEYEEEGFVAIDGYDGDITHLVERTEKNGVVIYRVWDSSGNEAMVQRTIHYDDPEAPVITLQGENPVWMEEGQQYTEQGYSAYDHFDGDLTDQVQVTVSDDAIVYRVTDAHGNVAEVTRQLLYEDVEAPVITLLGESVVTMTIGTAYDEPGFTAADNRDGDLTTFVEVSGMVQRYLAATYTLTYTVRDEAGNETSVERTVVVEPVSRVETVVPEGRIIYLTFDDGPGPHTQRLLEILAKYDVKATFFVVGTGSIALLDDIVDQGHSIAIHAYSHDYKKIYTSEEAYFEDMLAMQQLIYDCTGVWTTLVRFPGGSSNTVSRFNPGIMSRLTKAVQDMGFQYFDWNVDSNDAGGARDAATVAANVIAGCSGRRVSVVLQHDIKGYSVDAVEQIILWGLANGYTFLPMDPSSPTMHHGVNN